MFRNYFNIAVRSFLKDKSQGIITLLGLVIGLASVFMILAYVKYELSYDKHYSNHDRVYRLVSGNSKDGMTNSLVYKPFVYSLKDEFPEIESVTQINLGDENFQINNQPVKVKTLTTDSSFLNIFNFHFISGNPATALSTDRNLVITEKIARRFFPNQDPIGQVFTSKDYQGNKSNYRIAAVIRDIPANTHLQADVIVARVEKQEPLDWNGGTLVASYILLKHPGSEKGLENKFAAFIKKHNCPYDLRLGLQPVVAIHLHSHFSDERLANSDIRYVYIFSLVALLILAIACINYINLTIARSLQRIREVGVRKVMGAQKRELALQFTIESVLLFACTLPFALMLSRFLWPWFAGAIHVQASSEYLFQGRFIVGIVLICLLTGIISGSYPAFFLSGLRPAHILKDWQKSFSINLSIRKGLIVFQFVISVALVIATGIIYAQLNLLNNMPLGYDKNHLLILPTENFGHNADVFKNELKKNSNISAVSIASWAAGEYYGSGSSMDTPADSTKQWQFAFVYADYDFLKTMRVKLLSGRDFSASFGADHINNDSLFELMRLKKMNYKEFENVLATQSMIISEKAAKTMLVKAPVIGQTIKYSAISGTVVGMVGDFIGIVNAQETPMVIIKPVPNMGYGHPYVRINPNDIPRTVAYIQSVWKKLFPDTEFQFSFVDEKLQQSYDSQTRLASIFNSFSLLAILIAAMGLFSLVSLTVQQKTKEIGIRKVLGASVTEIVRLLSKDFVKLVALSILIASPIAWWAMHKWLEDFTYRISISGWIFVIAGGSCMALALVVVGWQSMRAAVANPVKSLRTE